jgi:hypothetical protein
MRPLCVESDKQIKLNKKNPIKNYKEIFLQRWQILNVWNVTHEPINICEWGHFSH